MKCPVCQKEIIEGANYCNHCGAKIEANPSRSEGLNIPSNPTEILQEQLRALAQINDRLDGIQTAQQQTDRRLKELHSEAEEINKTVTEPGDVFVNDIKMSFGSMVVFQIKWILASFLIAIVVFIILGLILLLFNVRLFHLISTLF